MPNSALPVVLIRGALDGPVDDDGVCALYRSNGWQGCWTWTIYDFHHYHSTAHEALSARSSGSATPPPPGSSRAR